MELKSIAEEVRDCRKAFKNSRIGDPVWLCHHGVLGELLTEEPEERILYILNRKPEDERALRLRLFRPIDVSTLPEKAKTAWGEHDKAKEKHEKTREEHEKARESYGKTRMESYIARDEYKKAWDKYYKAWEECDNALEEYDRALDEFFKLVTPYYHTLFPDSPWNGETIFSQR